MEQLAGVTGVKNVGNDMGEKVSECPRLGDSETRVSIRQVGNSR